MTIQEFKTHIEEELRHKLRGENEATPILDRLDKHLIDFDGYDLTDLLNPKNMKHDLYVSFLFQICFPSRIKMEIDAEYTPIKKKRIAIVSCKSRKQDYVCSADEMYSPSPVYRAQKDFCIKGYDEYLIVSSEYGLITPNHIIKPYNRTIGESGNNMAKENKIMGWDSNTLSLIEEQLKWMFKQGWIIDYHTSMSYYKYLSDDVKKKINYIKQPMGAGASVPKYIEATRMLDTVPLKECLKFISKRNTQPSEEDKWFYHKDYPPFFGTSGKLVRKYKGELPLNTGNMYKASIGLQPHSCGWVVDKSLLNKLYQTDSGQWRIKN
jgi:hypothetical protein